MCIKHLDLPFLDVFSVSVFLTKQHKSFIFSMLCNYNNELRRFLLRILLTRTQSYYTIC